MSHRFSQIKSLSNPGRLRLKMSTSRTKFIPKKRASSQLVKPKSVETKDADNPDTLQRLPKSFVLRTGQISKLASQLLMDLRKVMEPNTASRLQQKRRNRMRDFISMAGPLGVTHIILLSQSSCQTNLRIGRIPQGPTLHFNIQAYTLANEIIASQQRYRSNKLHYHTQSAFQTAPLLVLNNFPIERAEGKVLCSMLQNLFPAINTATVKLSEVKRVVLFSFEQRDLEDGETSEDENIDRGLIHFRHYVVGVKQVGLSRTVKRIIRSEIPDLGRFGDAADFLMQNEAALSDSEVEPDSIIDLGIGKSTVSLNSKNVSKPREQGKKAISLVECGPRMTLRLIKITEGLNDGKILFHHLPHEGQEGQKPTSSPNDDEDTQSSEDDVGM